MDTFALVADGKDFYDRPEVCDRFLRARVPEGLSDPTCVMQEPAVWEVLGDVQGHRVVDLGCGAGGFGRKLIAAGCASYLGVDGSKRMVEQARRSLRGTNGEAVLGEMERVDLPARSVDLIVSLLAMHYVAAIDEVLRRCHDALVPGGRLIVSVPHPVLTAAETSSAERTPRTSVVVDDYFATGPREREWLGSSVIWYHRTVEQYVRAIEAAALRLVTLRECPPVREAFSGDDGEFIR